MAAGSGNRLQDPGTPVSSDPNSAAATREKPTQSQSSPANGRGPAGKAHESVSVERGFVVTGSTTPTDGGEEKRARN